jgi:plasmid stability protein
MPTLYVENVPDDLCAALRRRPRAHRKSIAAQVLSLLEQNVPTAQELRVRQKLLRRTKRLQSQKLLSRGG